MPTRRQITSLCVFVGHGLRPRTTPLKYHSQMGIDVIHYVFIVRVTYSWVRAVYELGLAHESPLRAFMLTRDEAVIKLRL